MKLEKKIALLKERLNEDSLLPGWDSQKKMAVIPINDITAKAFIAPVDAKQASVAIILFEKDGNLSFLLTKRTSNVEHHKGQISLPGGGIDLGETPENASLRESNEEIGIDIASLRLVGKLSTLYTPVSHFNIHAYIWFSDQYPKIVKNQNEVEEVYEVSINELLSEEVLSITPISKEGMNINVPAYHFLNCVCWGATAMIISELKDILKNI
ncbi:CoA pyrophosphatase [Candidatus Marinimicrobia bacterium]|nr:CoA pyrophosphatase [Candidatus Neomarinimicrobiota bacterium]MDA9841302.1 CoA pyrophosphatase [Candidatus Neomarinimicrobiota bacterium]MDB3979823.1 CoA pyrophosphatase [Candidatus Neomarinimicrobiota bacterium]MDC0654096.1 CoA pyrophosphatase [Candidatus Neomarinimicrobiota bacterium]MDC1020872.1 CoA pyrophosphatase [Candidatus Neomarinimicrobiota bacterium]